ncbi:glycosyltransferase family 32 protein [Polaribacter uvawellassae]|uniref:glycosyltransferase family 32 protein n=1 Tax=Polaribacter uvawellassae TaxID=3133495 RepID=UPI003218F3AB
MEIKLDLSKLEPIPKIIHVSWKNKNILNSQSPLILNGLVNLKKLNPNYKLEISDDKDVDSYLIKNLSKWEYFKIKNKKIVEKLDLWRLIKIYKEGGIYIDIDRYCNISFNTVIKPNTKCVLPTYNDVDFSQDFMISSKGNPIFKKAIDYNLKGRYLINPRGVFHLGPPVYMRAVTEVVFGERKKRNPGSLIMEKYRELLEKSIHFQTYKENLPKDSFIFKYNKDTFLKGNGLDKDQFYKSQNVKPWSSGFDKNTIILAIIVAVLIILAYLIIK